MFRKILIANRGEIACRIARTCKRLGVAVAGVHSTADRNSLHVKEIGESIEIGEAPSTESYLNIEAIISAAKETGSEAIHPGFGFLAENASFARAVEEANLVFIGPPAELIERLGDKAAAKHEAKIAGVVTVPGSDSPSVDPKHIAKLANKIGLPLMLKAASGGGGKGMREIVSFDNLMSEIESAMREAKASFGDAGLIVEKLIQNSRHIEVQIAGDGQGHVVHLFERECTLQRRHQKLIEEAPAANLSKSLRDRMTADAVKLGKQLNYRGVGTVEFIVGSGEYYFLEVNPRLQVEHPVTEMITGFDIVEIMLCIAAGDGLSLQQKEIGITGHATEARICAEDPASGFLPSTGRLAKVRFPSEGVRVEAGVETGIEITPYYDPMIAKLIAFAPTRAAALDRLKYALDHTIIFGVTTNLNFLKRLIDLPQTRNSTFHTKLIDEEIPGWRLGQEKVDLKIFAIAALYWLYLQRRPQGVDPWASWHNSNWHMGGNESELNPIPSLQLESANYKASIRFGVQSEDGSTLVAVDDECMFVRLSPLDGEQFLVELSSKSEVVQLCKDGDVINVQDHHGSHSLKSLSYLSYISAAVQLSSEVRAPIMGILLEINIAPGDSVSEGDVVAIMSSMKMELSIVAACKGTVTKVNCEVGQTVERKSVIAEIEPDLE